MVLPHDPYIQGGHDVRYRTQCTVPDFLCTVRYGIKLVCTVFWYVRYFSGSEKKNSENSSLQGGKKMIFFVGFFSYILKARKS